MVSSQIESRRETVQQTFLIFVLSMGKLRSLILDRLFSAIPKFLMDKPRYFHHELDKILYIFCKINFHFIYLMHGPK